MRPIQVCLSIPKELRDSYQGLDDQIFCEAAEMLGRMLLEDGILERHLVPDINRPEFFHYILILNRRDLPEPKPEPKPMNIPSAGGGMSTTPPKFKLDVKPEQPVSDCHDLDNHTIMEEIRKCGCNPNEYDVARQFYELGLNSKK